jgi:hypothetical protein
MIEELIDKMMEVAGYNTRCHHLIQMGDYPWYSKYTWNKKEEEEFKQYFMKKVKKKYGKKLAEREWGWFNLQYGLRRCDLSY